MQYNSFAGVYALLATPFLQDRSIDIPAYEAYVQWQAQQCGQHLFAVCGSSEMTALTRAERLTLSQLAVKNAGGVPVFVTGNLEPELADQYDEIKSLEQAGVSGLVFVTKHLGEQPQALFDYLCGLAAQTTLPVMLYECPAFKPHAIDAQTFGKLAATGRFSGIKDTTCTMQAIGAKIAVQGDVNVLQANVPLLYDAYVAGARGVMATTTTCVAQLFSQMWNAFAAGDLETAKRTHEHIVLADGIIGSKFTCSAKYLLQLQGVQMQWYSRDIKKELSEANRREIEVFYQWAKHNGVLA